MHPRDNKGPGASSGEDAGRPQRMEALRALAHSQDTADDTATSSRSTTTPPIPLPAQRPARAPIHWLVVASVLCALLVVGVAVAATLKAQIRPSGSSIAPPPPIPGTLALALDQNHLTCPAQAAWAPDGLTIAVELTQQGCLASPGAPNALQVALFNARTGALVRLIDARRDLPAWTPGAPPPLIWSPDGKQLALDATAADAQGHILPGLLVIPVAGSNARYLQGSPMNALPSALVWDLKAGSLEAVSPLLQPALSYQWTSDGHIVAVRAMPPDATGNAPSGTPTSHPAAASLLFWGSGDIVPLQGFDKSGAGTPFLPPSAYTFVSDLRSWSPDGRFLALPLRLAARLSTVPGVPTSPLSPMSCPTPLLQPACTGRAVPLPDSALSAVIRTAAIPQQFTSGNKTTEQYNEDPFSIAWRPGGGLLATILPANGGNDTGQPIVRVALFSTVTGQPVANLDVAHDQSVSESQGAIASTIAWSPSGRQLALVDYSDNQVTIWGANRLPA